MENFKPKRIQSLVPYIFVKDIPTYLEFVQAAFGVNVITETKNDDGITFYATLQFDETAFFVQEPDEENMASNASLYLYVPDLDAAYKKAVSAGAISISEPAEQYHGDRLAILKDRWSNRWFLASTSVILNDDQIRERRQKEGI
jgi:PhnB protein